MRDDDVTEVQEILLEILSLLSSEDESDSDNILRVQESAIGKSKNCSRDSLNKTWAASSQSQRRCQIVVKNFTQRTTSVFELTLNLLFDQISDNQLSIQRGEREDDQRDDRQRDEQEDARETAAEKQISDVLIFYMSSFQVL